MSKGSDDPRVNLFGDARAAAVRLRAGDSVAASGRFPRDDSATRMGCAPDVKRDRAVDPSEVKPPDAADAAIGKHYCP
jgi:hypothetical protein